jgi:hypothetical protein
MKMKQLLIFISVMCAVNLSAQVTIGALEEPHEAAILDLAKVPSQNLGLLLPRVALTDLIPFQLLNPSNSEQENKATGMVVYNEAYVKDKVYPGIYVWDGTKWGRLNDGSVPTAPYSATCFADYYSHDTSRYVDIEVDADGGGAGVATKTLRFLTYNLGADPNLTPKQQMAYLNKSTDGIDDVNVYGGLYQWGRKDTKHCLRCANSGANTIFFRTARYPKATYNPDTTTQFVRGQDDWIDSQTNNLWGNGLRIEIGSDENKGGIWYNDAYYQNTDWTYLLNNNPCPAGFRVPTQHEWALIGKEDGNPTHGDGDVFSISNANGTSPNDFVTWVPVCGGFASNVWNASDNPIIRGYALYRKTVWDAATQNDASGYFEGTTPNKSLTDAAAPEPLLFLPAAGQRTTGGLTTLTYVGANGYYWGSQENGVACRALSFASNDVQANFNVNRAVGCSVRCIAETQ